eukprot:CAMPEP_0119312342 /NCGR_PEP_ID=MMETSP1333-20130426/26031_1 /TAXON_ID=418940 /ORGANISM="Scyphosphaera apsteinii, Strain RCC1455" /LENGTH=530 /DNA_ID=CAMNT_0007316947 /DNA_START=84 /DNA_END=1676 /DNA_ORIENTATION=+
MYISKTCAAVDAKLEALFQLPRDQIWEGLRVGRPRDKLVAYGLRFASQYFQAGAFDAARELLDAHIRARSGAGLPGYDNGIHEMKLQLQARDILSDSDPRSTKYTAAQGLDGRIPGASVVASSSSAGFVTSVHASGSLNTCSGSSNAQSRLSPIATPAKTPPPRLSDAATPRAIGSDTVACTSRALHSAGTATKSSRPKGCDAAQTSVSPLSVGRVKNGRIKFNLSISPSDAAATPCLSACTYSPVLAFQSTHNPVGATPLATPEGNPAASSTTPKESSLAMIDDRSLSDGLTSTAPRGKQHNVELVATLSEWHRRASLLQAQAKMLHDALPPRIRHLSVLQHGGASLASGTNSGPVLPVVEPWIFRYLLCDQQHTQAVSDSMWDMTLRSAEDDTTLRIQLFSDAVPSTVKLLHKVLEDGALYASSCLAESHISFNLPSTSSEPSAEEESALQTELAIFQDNNGLAELLSLCPARQGNAGVLRVALENVESVDASFAVVGRVHTGMEQLINMCQANEELHITKWVATHKI